MERTFKPSEVVLSIPPLIGTMGRAEAEAAAAVIVRGCQVLGDKWQPLRWSQIEPVLKADSAANVQPFAFLVRNPFFSPNALELIDRGFARWTDESAGELEFTEEAFAAMSKWVLAPETLGPRQVWSNGYEWYVARSRDELKMLYRANTGLDIDTDEDAIGDGWEERDPEDPLRIQREDAEDSPIIMKTCAEWAESEPVGFLCSTEW